MTRSELEHAIRAACDVADDTEVWVFGSQSILGQFPSAPEALRQSAEADIAPRNHPERVDRIDATGRMGFTFTASPLSLRRCRPIGSYEPGLFLEEERAKALVTVWKDMTLR